MRPIAAAEAVGYALKSQPIRAQLASVDLVRTPEALSADLEPPAAATLA